MKIVQHEIRNVSVLALSGRLDASSSLLLLGKLSETTCFHRRVVVDLSAVDFMDSSGLGALIVYARKLRENSGDLKLACPNDQVRMVFELTRADRLFDIYDDPDAAIDGFQGEEGT